VFLYALDGFSLADCPIVAIANTSCLVALSRGTLHQPSTQGKSCSEWMPVKRPASLAPAFDLRTLDEVSQDVVSQTHKVQSKHAPTEVLEHVVIGSCADAKDPVTLRSLGITHVLTAAKELQRPCGDEGDVPSDVIPSENRLVIPLRDRHDEDIAQHFDASAKFIDNAKKSGGRVLVHCRRGVSRSPTLVVAYLMRSLNLTFEEAMDLVTTKRTCVSINLGFRVSLEDYDQHRRLASSLNSRSSNDCYAPTPLKSPSSFVGFA
jgi:hypothetical protein